MTETVQSVERLTALLSDEAIRKFAQPFDSTGSAGAIHHFRFRERDLIRMLCSFASEIERALDDPQPQKRPLKRMTFDEMKRQAADDLRRVADLFELRARAIEQGDFDQFYKLITEELQNWHQMLVLRQADRAERREIEHQGCSTQQGGGRRLRCILLRGHDGECQFPE